MLIFMANVILDWHPFYLLKPFGHIQNAFFRGPGVGLAPIMNMKRTGTRNKLVLEDDTRSE